MSKAHIKKTEVKKVAKKYSILSLGVFLLLTAFVINLAADQKEKKETINKKVEVNKVDTSITPTIEVVSAYPTTFDFTSQSYLVYDLKTKKVVAGKDINTRVANASTTKLMSALVALETFPLDKVITVPGVCLGIDGSNANFYEGEQYFFEDMLYAILLRSAADATCAVANSYPGGEQAFVAKMNVRAKELSLDNTNYINPIGLDANNHYSSSEDLLKLILKIKDINKLNIVMGSRYFTLNSINTRRQTTVANTNELLFKLPGTVGYKTGTTSNAGECLVFGYNNLDTNLIIIVMGSKNRFYDAAELLDIYVDKNESIVNKPFIEEATKIFQPVIPSLAPVITPTSPLFKEIKKKK